MLDYISWNTGNLHVDDMKLKINDKHKNSWIIFDSMTECLNSEDLRGSWSDNGLDHTVSQAIKQFCFVSIAGQSVSLGINCPVLTT